MIRQANDVLKINKIIHEVPTCCSRPVPFWLVTLLILLPSGTQFSELCSRNNIKTQSTINLAQTQIHNSHEKVSIFLSEINHHLSTAVQFLFFWVFFQQQRVAQTRQTQRMNELMWEASFVHSIIVKKGNQYTVHHGSIMLCTELTTNVTCNNSNIESTVSSYLWQCLLI